MAENATNQPVERENPLAGSIIIFVVLMALFIVGLVLVSFLDLTTTWPMAALIVGFAAAFFIPMTFLGRSDSGSEHRN
ncbi:hypothetical protein SPF06_18150 [Sinomonas sp. JGH33]|uniref:Uncharacterized protein n=1 Tax=Sinomonas terricola TaxID=3110330 RepID=A0ABU5TAW4_9MICC|nr:hypothetical protein [Sinomonas sp. JGH33]MEA5456650.1 hypothetical protein [Sinomonas sp. JGH33]